jgi:hypothetical protein
MLQFSRNVPKITERSASVLRILDSPALRATRLRGGQRSTPSDGLYISRSDLDPRR